jgi:hypothetical protein
MTFTETKLADAFAHEKHAVLTNAKIDAIMRLEARKHGSIVKGSA